VDKAVEYLSIWNTVYTENTALTELVPLRFLNFSFRPCVFQLCYGSIFQYMTETAYTAHDHTIYS